MNLPEIPADKANHAVYGALLAVAAFSAALMLGASPGYASAVAMGLAMAVGGLKEAADAWVNRRATGTWRIGPRSVDLLDAAWTVAGAALVLVAVHLPGVIRP